MVTVRNFLADIYLSIRWGSWHVERERCRWAGVYRHYAICDRSGDKILCVSKPEAEVFCAIHNDNRGAVDTDRTR